jgi:plastocyanin
MRGVLLVGLSAVLLASCGGSKNPLTPDTGGPGPSGATITILATGAIDVKQVTVTAGQSVTVVNNDTRAHQIASDPHPEHTNCPSINALGTLQPGQTRLTNAFSTSASCGFHDHGDPNNQNLQGRITVQ